MRMKLPPLKTDVSHFNIGGFPLSRSIPKIAVQECTHLLAFPFPVSCSRNCNFKRDSESTEITVSPSGKFCILYIIKHIFTLELYFILHFILHLCFVHFILELIQFFLQTVYQICPFEACTDINGQWRYFFFNSVSIQHCNTTKCLNTQLFLLSTSVVSTHSIYLLT